MKILLEILQGPTWILLTYCIGIFPRAFVLSCVSKGYCVGLDKDVVQLPLSVRKVIKIKKYPRAEIKNKLLTFNLSNYTLNIKLICWTVTRHNS